MVFNVRDSDRHIKKVFPHEVEEIEHVWIPMSDGVKLAAKIWLPKSAHTTPVPAILEYIPYRKNEFTALRDSLRHPYFAGHGYASIRVDIRGSGDSEGILEDEYLKLEQDDALEVLDWISEQPWSTGAVGMIGKSWGGFNGLQVAARQHPALKTIITICSTDDRYKDDVHYKGGSILASDMLWWASTMFAYNARPADPKYVGDNWRDMWMERLEKTPPFVEEWMRHQRRDEYWKHGSVCEDYEAVDIPVFAVGGWADGYTNAVFRLMEHLKGPKKALLGPWAHEYPEVAVPGPQIGFLQECIRWWDEWLKGKNTGIMDEAPFRLYMQDAVPPETHYDFRTGSWMDLDGWPNEAVSTKDFYLQGNQLIDQHPKQGEKIHLKTHMQHGLYAGVFCPFGQEGDMPSDQSIENGLSTTLTSDILEEDLPILGFSHADLQVICNKKQANLAVRLCDLSPDGESKLITWGQLNLTHRNSDEFPEPVPIEKEFDVSIELDAIGYIVPKGHRIQLSVSPFSWPHIWPSAEIPDIYIVTDQSKLTIPVLYQLEKYQVDRPFEHPETAEVLEREIIRDAKRTREIRHNTVTNEWILDDFSDEGARRLPSNGIVYSSTNRNVYTIKERDPLSAKITCDWVITVGRDEDWQTKIETTSTMVSDEGKFYITNHLKAFEGEKKVYDDLSNFVVKRDYM